VAVTGHLHASASLPLLEEPLYPLARRLVGPQRKCGKLDHIKLSFPGQESSYNPSDFEPIA